jgi:hypothetical protein
MSNACYSCQVLMNLDSRDRLSKNTQMSDFIKIRFMGAELFHADGQMDRQI